MHVGAHPRPRQAIPAQQFYIVVVILAHLFYVVNRQCFVSCIRMVHTDHPPPVTVRRLAPGPPPHQLCRRDPHAPGAADTAQQHRVHDAAVIMQCTELGATPPTVDCAGGRSIRRRWISRRHDRHKVASTPRTTSRLTRVTQNTLHIMTLPP